MRGRTNVSGGGLDISGTQVQYEVKSGATINEGDFVQLDDNVISEDTSVVMGNIKTGASTFTLSDGKQITFFANANAIYALIEEITSAGVVTATIKQVTGITDASYRDYFIKVDTNKFLAFIASRTSQSNVYYMQMTMYIVEYNTSTGTFTVTSKGTVADKLVVPTYGSNNYPCTHSYMFTVKNLGSNKVLLAYVTYLDGNMYSGKLKVDLLNYSTKTVLATYSSTYVFNSTDYASTWSSNDPQADRNTALVGNLFIFNPIYKYGSAKKCYDIEVDATNDTLTEKGYLFAQTNIDKIIPLTSTKLIACPTGTTGYLYEITSSGYSQISTITLPFTVNQVFRINSKTFVVKKTATSAINATDICEVTFNNTTNEVSFSGVSEGMVFEAVQHILEVTPQYFSTYTYGNNNAMMRKTVKENNGLITSFDLVRKAKAYVNRIDGVALDSGTGGDTITVVIP